MRVWLDPPLTDRNRCPRPRDTVSSMARNDTNTGTLTATPGAETGWSQTTAPASDLTRLMGPRLAGSGTGLDRDSPSRSVIRSRSGCDPDQRREQRTGDLEYR